MAFNESNNATFLEGESLTLNSKSKIKFIMHDFNLKKRYKYA